MPKKKPKEHEGNLYAAIFLGLVTAAFGAMLGIASLALQPVEEVREMPKEENIKADRVYYVRGKEGGGTMYKAKQKAFLQRNPGQLRLTEEDLNRWAADNFKFAKPTKEEEEAAGVITMRPTVPNFRIADGVMQIGMNVEVEAFGNEYKMRYFAKGNFEPTAMGYAFVPNASYLGSGKLPPVAVGSFVGDTLLGVFQNTEQYPVLNEAWISLTNVGVQGNELILVR